MTVSPFNASSLSSTCGKKVKRAGESIIYGLLNNRRARYVDWLDPKRDFVGLAIFNSWRRALKVSRNSNNVSCETHKFTNSLLYVVFKYEYLHSEYQLF